MANPAMTACAQAHPTGEPSDLDVAIHLGRKLLGSDNPQSLREALRILLRAVGVEDGAQ